MQKKAPAGAKNNETTGRPSLVGITTSSLFLLYLRLCALFPLFYINPQHLKPGASAAGHNCQILITLQRQKSAGDLFLFSHDIYNDNFFVLRKHFIFLVKIINGNVDDITLLKSTYLLQCVTTNIKDDDLIYFFIDLFRK